MRIAILDDIHDAWRHTQSFADLEKLGEVVVFQKAFGSPAALDGFEVLIANRERTRFDKALLAQLTGVKLIVQTGNHANHVDFDAAKSAGILIGKASGGYSVGAAELAIGLTLAGMRHIPMLDTAVRRGEWETPTTPVLQGKTFGVVGLGKVGSHAARIASAFGMRILAWSPGLDEARARAAGAISTSLDDLLRESDVVSIHAALTPESRDLIDARRLGLMRQSAWLINTARGPIVNEAALLNALQNNQIAGAGLDVFDREPLPPNHPFLSLPNVVLTPHIGWPTDSGYENFAKSVVEVLTDYLAGKELPGFKRR